MYLAHNMFVLPRHLNIKFSVFNSYRKCYRFFFSEKAKTMVKHVGIEMGSRERWYLEKATDPGSAPSRPIRDGIQPIIYSPWEIHPCMSTMSDYMIVFRDLETVEIECHRSYSRRPSRGSGCCETVLVDECYLKTLQPLRDIRIIGLWGQEVTKEKVLLSWCQNSNRRLRYLNEEAPQITVEDLHRQHKITFGPEGDPWRQYQVDTGYSYESDGEV